ncbi:MAG: hypothetical protein V4739_11485 [Pseudomonadota bacterium]
MYPESAVLAAESLLSLVAPNDESRRRLCARLHHELSEEGDHDYFSELPIIWILAHFSSFFYVDWKNNEDFQPFVEKLAHDWGATSFHFPPDLRTEMGEPLTVPELMQWARYSLEPQGLLLWHWHTHEDNYCGAVSREKDWSEIVRVCEQLGIAAFPGDQQFGEEVEA